MQTFIPGMKLSEAFFGEAVAPIVELHWPGVAFSAARLDFGSDVLGFDNAPYIKWFGTAFARLRCARQLVPVFRAVMRSERWRQRQERLSTAYRMVMRMHNDLGVTAPIEPEVSAFHNRPYKVPHAERFVEALHAAIRCQTVRAWPRSVGAVWQFADSTDVLDSIERCKALARTCCMDRDTT